MHGAPICHSLAYFSKSPFRLDFDYDFFGKRQADLAVRAEIRLVGAIGWQRIYAVKQTVELRDLGPGASGQNVPPTAMIVLLERGAGEFCDIYQNQYTYDPTQETDEVSIIDIGGRKVLKVFETDRNTAYLTYWAIQDRTPLRLSYEGLYTVIDSAVPAGSFPFRRFMDITGSRFTARIDGESQDVLGHVDLELAVRANEIVAIRKTWTPSGVAHAR
jgi:hypothetical protein